MSAASSLGTIVTFYSWKGGVGRTMALANVAIQLARKGRRVLAVDWDLEAPGLHRYFLEGEGSDKIGKTAPEDPTGLMGLLLHASEGADGIASESVWKSRVYHLTVPGAAATASRPLQPSPGSLHMLASGLGSEHYGQNVANFSWANFFANSRGGEWLESLRRQWREQYDFVLIDSRTGLTDSGGVCTVQMPDILTLVFTSNEQSLEDGLRFVESVQATRKDFAYDRPPLAVLPLLSRWDGDDEVDLGTRWLEKMDSRLKPFISSWFPKDFTPYQFLEKIRVPHVARFSFGEPLPVITHSLTDTNLPGLAFESVAQLLTSNLSSAARAIDPHFEPSPFTAGYQSAEDLNELSLVRDPVALQREIARLSRAHGPNSRELSIFLNNAGLKLKDIARYAEAEPLMRRALAINEASLGSAHPEVAVILNNLAQLLQATNRLAEAEPLMRRALAIDESSFGSEHPEVAGSLNNLALLLSDTNRLAEAEPLMRRALAIQEASFGSENPNVAVALNNLASLLQDTNRFAEAEPLMRRALAIDESRFGSEHPEVAVDLNNLAQLLKDTNRLTEAEPLMRRALAIDESSFGSEHPKVAVRLNNLAQLLQDTNRLSEAEPLMRRALAIDEASFGSEHPNVAVALNNLASLLQDTNRRAEAEPLMRRAFEILTKSLPRGHPHLELVEENYRLLCQKLGTPDDEIAATVAQIKSLRDQVTSTVPVADSAPP